MSDQSVADQAKTAVGAAEGAATKEVNQTVAHGANYIAHHALTVAAVIGAVALVSVVALVLALHH